MEQNLWVIQSWIVQINEKYQRDNEDGWFLPLGQSVLYNKVYFDFDLELKTFKWSKVGLTE